MNDIHDLAIEYIAAGVSVIPLRLDGSKAPALKSWEPYQKRLATDDELRQWFSRPAGIGIVGGAVSGGLEILDFDDGDLFHPWFMLAEQVAIWLPIVETPSGGYHVFYRCCEICGNSKIAKDPSKPDKKTLIETRGQAGYVAGVGSGPGVHQTGLPYVQVYGPPLPEIPSVTPEQRRILWRAARSFDRRPVEVMDRLKRLSTGRATYTGNQDTHPLIVSFNHRMSWEQILEPHGWRTIDGRVWTRPGDKRPGTKSASVFVAKDGSEVLVVWSGNAGALAPELGDKKTWNKFFAWAALNFRGDGKAAFARLREAAA